MKDEPRYDALQILDDGSDSSTEVDEWDPEIESKAQLRRKRKGVWKKLAKWRWLVDTLILVELVVILGFLAEKRWAKHVQHKNHRYELTGDITGFAPRCMYCSLSALIAFTDRVSQFPNKLSNSTQIRYSLRMIPLHFGIRRLRKHGSTLCPVRFPISALVVVLHS